LAGLKQVRAAVSVAPAQKQLAGGQVKALHHLRKVLPLRTREAGLEGLFTALGVHGFHQKGNVHGAYRPAATRRRTKGACV
jgi:hypothetical protein